MTDMTVVDYLKAARQDYEEHGFAVGNYMDDHGNRCALGSLVFVASEGAGFRPMHVVGDKSKYRLYFIGIHILGEIAKRLHDYSEISAVNDDPSLGRPAVLECFDLAIKEKEEAAK